MGVRVSSEENAPDPRQQLRWFRISDITALLGVLGVFATGYAAFTLLGHRVTTLESTVMDVKKNGSDEVRGLRAEVKYVVERVGAMEGKLDRLLYAGPQPRYQRGNDGGPQQ